MDKAPESGQEAAAAPIETIDVQFINKDDYGDEEEEEEEVMKIDEAR